MPIVVPVSSGLSGCGKFVGGSLVLTMLRSSPPQTAVGFPLYTGPQVCCAAPPGPPPPPYQTTTLQATYLNSASTTTAQAASSTTFATSLHTSTTAATTTYVTYTTSTSTVHATTLSASSTSLATTSTASASTLADGALFRDGQPSTHFNSIQLRLVMPHYRPPVTHVRSVLRCSFAYPTH